VREAPEEDQLQEDTGGGADVTKCHQTGGQLHERVGIDVKRDLVMAQGLAEGAERHALRLIVRHVRLQGINTPGIVENISNNVDVGSVISAVALHLCLLSLFISYLRRKIAKNL
jgi:hypothetical protein